MKFKHPDAIKLLKVADKYLAWNQESFSGDAKMLACGEKDYQDFISIALMIESDESNNKIGRAINNLDTFVRDHIPNDIYKRY